MKVLHVIPSLAPIHGGPSRAIATMENALRSAGVMVDIATTDDNGIGLRLAATCNTPSNHHIFAKRTEFYKVSPALGTWLRQHIADYDLVHIHALFSYSSIAASRAARHEGVPYIIRPLGTLTRYSIEQRRPWLKKASLRWLDGPALRHAAAVHFTAEAEREEAEQLGISFRSAIVPLAVNPGPSPNITELQALYPQLQTGQHLLFLSRLDPKKNVEGLLKAMAALRTTHPGLQLLVVGEGNSTYVNQLKMLSSSLGLRDNVIWAGFLDGPLKAAAFWSAKVFVLPSFSENFGIAAAEALLAGLPCILGSGIAIANEVAAAGAGCTVEPNSLAIARGIASYLDDSRRCSAAAAAARAFAEQEYSVERLGERLFNLYFSIVQEPQKRE